MNREHQINEVVRLWGLQLRKNREDIPNSDISIPQCPDWLK